MNSVHMRRLEVITGPMFSGKSAELVRRVQLAQIAHLRAAVFRPQVDTRTRDAVVISRTGASINANVIPDAKTILASADHDVIAVDEAQFFGADLLEVVENLVHQDKWVIVAGIDLDFAERPFGPMPQLLAMADSVDKLTAVCNQCQSMFANRTQRLIQGEPALPGPQIIIDKFDKYRPESSEHDVTYEARCFDCYISPS